MRATTDSNWDLRAINYTLGYADGLVVAHRWRNEPTEEHVREPFRQGLSDAERRRPFGRCGRRPDRGYRKMYVSALILGL